MDLNNKRTVRYAGTANGVMSIASMRLTRVARRAPRHLVKGRALFNLSVRATTSCGHSACPDYRRFARSSVRFRALATMRMHQLFQELVGGPRYWGIV